MHIPKDILIQALVFFERGYSSEQIAEMDFCKEAHIKASHLRPHLENSHEAVFRKEENDKVIREGVKAQQEEYNKNVIDRLKKEEGVAVSEDTYEKLLKANKEFTKFVLTGLSSVANSFKDMTTQKDGKTFLIEASKESFLKMDFVARNLQFLALFIQTVTHSNNFIRENPYQFKEEQVVTTHEYLAEVGSLVKERQEEMLKFADSMRKASKE